MVYFKILVLEVKELQKHTSKLVIWKEKTLLVL